MMTLIPRSSYHIGYSVMDEENGETMRKDRKRNDMEKGWKKGSGKGEIEGNPEENESLITEQFSEEDFESSRTRRRMTLRRAMPQFLATNAKNILLLGYGMTVGFPTIVIPSVMESTSAEPERRDPTVRMTDAQVSWFSSIHQLCVPLGCVLSGVVTQPFGRKMSMIALNIPFIFAWIMFHYAATVQMMYLALAITGIAGGLMEAPVLTYVSEITEPEVRGIFAAMSSMCVILGVFIQFLMGTLMIWRSAALVNIAFPLIAIAAMSFVPESPHWLIGQKRFKEAELSLQCLRGWVSADVVSSELDMLKKAILGMKEKPITDEGRMRLYFSRSFLSPTAIITVTFLVSHFGGMTPVQTYAVNIFAAVGSPLNSYMSTVVLGLVELLGAAICMCLVRSTGKRPLALVSTLGGALSILMVALLNKDSLQSHKVLSLLGIVSSAFFFHICMRPLPWMLIGEVYPPEIRATSSGLAGGIGYIVAFSANKSYLYIVKNIGLYGTLLLYSIVAFVGVVILYFILPETEDLTLKEIQDLFKTDKKRSVNRELKKDGNENEKRKKSGKTRGKVCSKRQKYSEKEQLGDGKRKPGTRLRRKEENTSSSSSSTSENEGKKTSKKGKSKRKIRGRRSRGTYRKRSCSAKKSDDFGNVCLVDTMEEATSDSERENASDCGNENRRKRGKKNTGGREGMKEGFKKRGRKRDRERMEGGKRKNPKRKVCQPPSITIQTATVVQQALEGGNEISLTKITIHSRDSESDD